MTTVAAAPTTFAEAQEVLAANLPGYTRREHQIALAEAIEQTLRDEKPAGLMQAGTGTGKSLAALITLILTGKRSVVATATKALQNQYSGKDLPFLQENLGVDFAWAVLKGRSNYPCWIKAQDLTSPTPGQRTVLDRMGEIRPDPNDGGSAVIEGEIIDREDFPAVDDREWSAFAMGAAECAGKDCPFYRQCFTQRAKAKAAEADIVITNIAYLLTDLTIRQSSGGNVALLGDYENLLVDEAHNLPDRATDVLQDSFTESTFRRLARDAGGYLLTEGEEETAEEIERAAQILWMALEPRWATWKLDKGTDPMPLPLKLILSALGDGIAGLYQAVDATYDAVAETRPQEGKAKVARLRLMNRLAAARDRLAAFSTDPATKTVRWVEEQEFTVRGERRSALCLRSAPIDVGPWLREVIWDTTGAIMMSATLATGNDFSFLAGQMGLRPGEAREFRAGSPFDYTRQMRLYVPPADVPVPSGATTREWRVWSQQATSHLVTQAGGGALLLFTSRTGMNDAYNAMARTFQSRGLTVLKQGDMPVPELVRQFREDGNAVLFGLRTFFEGIDIPSRALRLVVLDKLPFAVPTDILWAARCDAVVRKYGARKDFPMMTIPAMILTLTQAFGRLIRHHDDAGLVAILDSRLTGKTYGRGILAALPPAPVVTDIHQAGDFLAGLR